MMMQMIKCLNKFFNIVDSSINFITTTFFIIIISLGIYAIYDSYYIYDNAQLGEDIINLSPEIAEENFSLATLQEINEDICGWIRIDDTNIDYPILISDDNTEYLNIDYKKEYSTSGSIFLDYRNNRNFKDDYSIIYGHNMKAGLMFSDIKKYNDLSFFNSHTKGTLYTDSGQYELNIICITNVNAFSNNIYNLMTYKNGQINNLLITLSKNATNKTTINFEKSDKLLLLSTCNTAGSNDRVVLAAKMTKVNNDAENSQYINEGTDSSLKKIDEQDKILTSSETTNSETTQIEKIDQPENYNIIPLRTLSLTILTIFVIVIFIILLINIITIKLNKKK